MLQHIITSTNSLYILLYMLQHIRSEVIIETVLVDDWCCAMLIIPDIDMLSHVTKSPIPRHHRHNLAILLYALFFHLIRAEIFVYIK